MNAVKFISSPEHIGSIASRIIRKLEVTRRVIVRCGICDRIHMPKLNSEERREGLCDICLKAYGHIYPDNSTYEV